MKEDYGDLEELKKLGKEKNLTFTQEQCIHENLKNVGGESKKEVQKRMTEFFEECMNRENLKNIAVISHGASIKFFLEQYCNLNENIELTYKDRILFVNSPSVFKISVMEGKVKDILQIYG